MSETKSKVDKNLSLLKPILSYWRVVNTIVLIIAMLAPWLSGLKTIGSIGIGGEPAPYPGWFVMLFFIIFPPALIAPISLLLYFILSLRKLISSNVWLRYLLFILAGVNFLVFVCLTWFLLNEGLLWGYWLICVGILSSLMLETIDFNLLVGQEKINSSDRVSS